MISQAMLVLAEAEGEGFGAPHADHNHILVGLSVFLGLTLALLITLSFNRDR
jgi:hypothetical protein